MTDDIETIAATFDDRAANFAKHAWHRHYAERLVELTPLAANQRVLDAGAGTGFATIAIARRVGASGQVVAVDVSPGMLFEARRALEAENITTVELVQGDAVDLHLFASSSFDVVICSSALLYMPAARALGEWHRLLVPGGLVGFSTMRTGSPLPGRLFRQCASEVGIVLDDPSAELGSEEGSRAALDAAEFSQVTIVPGDVRLTADDLAHAWESNFRSAAHTPVRALPPQDLDALRARYESVMQRARLADADALARVEVLYAFARK